MADDVVPVPFAVSAWKLSDLRKAGRDYRRKTKSASRKVVESVCEATEIPYDDWLKQAAAGKFDSWLKRDPSTYSGNVTLGFWSSEVPPNGLYVVDKPLEGAFGDLVTISRGILPDFSNSSDAKSALDAEIIVNNATIIVAKADGNEIVWIYSRQPYCTLAKEQLKVALKEFELAEEIQWGSEVGGATRPVNASDYFNRRRGTGRSSKQVKF